MLNLDLINLLQKNDPEAKRQVFELYYSRFVGIATRFAKNASQGVEMFDQAFNHALTALAHQRLSPATDAESFFVNEFITGCIAFVKGIRSEYYVSSTVHASAGNTQKNYNLFDTHEMIDFKTIDVEVMINALQKLVPAQRLVFNLHVVDGFSLTDVAARLETSEETVKSNLEKARYNFQKNIERDLKTITVL